MIAYAPFFTANPSSPHALVFAKKPWICVHVLTSAGNTHRNVSLIAIFRYEGCKHVGFITVMTPSHGP